MKSPVHLNSLLLKFFYYVTWFDETLEAVQTRSIYQNLLFLSGLKTTSRNSVVEVYSLRFHLKIWNMQIIWFPLNNFTETLKSPT